MKIQRIECRRLGEHAASNAAVLRRLGARARRRQTQRGAFVRRQRARYQAMVGPEEGIVLSKNTPPVGTLNDPCWIVGATIGCANFFGAEVAS